MPRQSRPLQFKPEHNHQPCVDRAIKTANQICRQRNLRFTPIRQRVLELIWVSHQPMLAYDLLKQLRQDKHNAEPPTVYRALGFLMQHQFIHKIESLNAYIGCDHPQQDHTSQFMICSDCHQVAELEEPEIIEKAICKQASKIGFKVSNQTVEIVGLCPSCQ